MSKDCLYHIQLRQCVRKELYRIVWFMQGDAFLVGARKKVLLGRCKDTASASMIRSL